MNYGTDARSTWFSLEELLVNEKAVFAKLSGPGSTLLMTKSKNRFKKLIEDASDYRPANVAGHSGWCGKSFVFGDGTIASPKDHHEKIIVAFDTNPKFAVAGSLDAWLTGIDIRMALLSTSNEALGHLVKASKEVVGAVSSRMVTIKVNKASGVLDTVPDRYENVSEAAAHLRKHCARNYAHPGRIFAARLVEAAAEDEDKLRTQIAKRMSAFLGQLSQRRRTDGTSERVKTIFAMIFAAGTLARKWGLLPEEWGGLTNSLLNVFDRMEGRSVKTGSTPSSALERVKKYAQEHGNDIVRVKTMSGPVSFKKFSRSPGYLLRRDGKKAVLIPSERFQLEFEDHKAMMQELRRLGLAKTEGGNNPKLTVKTPSGICAEGRVYWVLLGSD
ncbi:DUF927 domain-containing protein [Mesorhizobium sp. B292B1B]|uniref:DUF927 domain-containing protein n=1 Tax=unclassified Mesorhizobium TaxID=325217 RepID=UPI0015E4928E|nr:MULTISPECIES: DUF927 domain-containing protein [unclassified Mesorhizobium]MCA0012904.1 DUF927 domain-containing protein [Mesorhizobium sp. B294B1A1]MCA0037595.1 DUF927 domain-containing protein [Mesorhizobium sp. B292B1B]